MAYLIPKSARNVKLQLFKGLGLIEIVIIIIIIIITFILLSVLPVSLGVKIGIGIFMCILTVFLVSPSFLVNKKGYQTFGVVLTYLTQQKGFRKSKSVVNKNG